MTAIAVRNHSLTVGGGLLAAAGLMATLAVGPAAFAADAETLASAEVASTISLTGATGFTLAEAPGVTASSTSALKAESNSGTGYNVTVPADQADLLPSDPSANTHSIPVSSLKVRNTAATPTMTGLSTGTPVTVHTQDTSSIEGGDTLTASYELEMPFVNADTYSGGLTFTATAK